METSGAEQSALAGPPSCRASACRCVSWTMLLTGALLIGLIGTWLVWFSFELQQKSYEEDIRAACRRLMPETVDRCFDTVVIQRGGIRR